MISVTTRNGKVIGKRFGNANAYLGIPFAAPPVGKLRWMPPQPPRDIPDPLDATEFPNRCHQPPYPEILGDVPSPGGLSEDCLYLNVFTPGNAAGKRCPVMFWIHGGAFIQGSANDFDASALAAENDVVVVCINYRLGVFGYLDLSSFGLEFEGSANLGCQDQIAALRWVHENIEAFGGDPDNVMIFGESAGGGSVMALLAAPDAEGLFHKAVALSPGPVNFPPNDGATNLANYLGTEKEHLLEKLRSMSGQELSEAQLFAGFIPVPSVDGKVITRPTYRAVAERRGVGIPIIAGTTKDEGTLLAPFMDYHAALAVLPREIVLGDETDAYVQFVEGRHADRQKRLEQIIFDMFRSNVLRVAEHSRTDTWVYRFDLPTMVNDGALGATHGSTTPFIFNAYASELEMLCKFHDASDPVVRSHSRSFSAMLARFARTGNPNGNGIPEWPTYTLPERNCLMIDAQLRIQGDPDRGQREVYGGCGRD